MAQAAGGESRGQPLDPKQGRFNVVLPFYGEQAARKALLRIEIILGFGGIVVNAETNEQVEV